MIKDHHHKRIMQIAELKTTHSVDLINGYDRHSISIQQQRYEQSILLLPDCPVTIWDINDAHCLTEKQLDMFVAKQPQIVIIGTGLSPYFCSQQFYAYLSTHGIGLELMTTAAACRTYNLLVQEGRRVAAGLILNIV
jgi:uncharacterized protein